MPDPSLDGCRAKLARAREHLQSLYDEINAFVASNPHEVVTEHDPEGRAYEVFLKVQRQPEDPRWGVLLGDVLHNMRCSLDHLVWQLVVLNGSKPGPQNQFPIATAGAQYWSLGKHGQPSMRERMLKGVADEHRAMIDAMQPYRRGRDAKRDPLAILAEFSNADKHRVVHPTLVAIEEPDFDRDFNAWVTGDADGFVDVTFHRTGPVEDGAKLLTARFSTDDPDARVQMNADIPIGIGFGKTGLRAEAVGEFYGIVGKVLDAFQPFFPG